MARDLQQTKLIGDASGPGAVPSGFGPMPLPQNFKDLCVLMGFHAFSLDPRTILGVGPDATMEQIHEAYRAKSKKHHPDMGATTGRSGWSRGPTKS